MQPHHGGRRAIRPQHPLAQAEFARAYPAASRREPGVAGRRVHGLLMAGRCRWLLLAMLAMLAMVSSGWAACGGTAQCHIQQVGVVINEDCCTICVVVVPVMGLSATICVPTTKKPMAYVLPGLQTKKVIMMPELGCDPDTFAKQRECRTCPSIGYN